MALDSRGELVGSVRLISTVMPHMMSGPFRDMFPDIGFSSPLIWEATRFAVLGDAATQPNGLDGGVRADARRRAVRARQRHSEHRRRL